jgi:predicted nucleic acid-binding protein
MKRIEALTVVFDTDVLFSKKRRLVIAEAAVRELVVGVWSPYVIAELIRTSSVAWIGRHGQHPASLAGLRQLANDMMDAMLASLVLVDTGPRDRRNHPPIRDIDDRHLIAAAKLSTADLVVSNNVRDFPARDKDGRHFYDRLEFVTYAAFVERLNIDEASFLNASNTELIEEP